MEKECKEKKVLEQEAAEEIQDEQMECVSGGQVGTGNEDRGKVVVLGNTRPRLFPRGNEDRGKVVVLGTSNP